MGVARAVAGPIVTPAAMTARSIGRLRPARPTIQLLGGPGHPDADEKGYVARPNINMTTEFVDALEATRAYEANIGVIEITKDMGERTLQILA